MRPVFSSKSAAVATAVHHNDGLPEAPAHALKANRGHARSLTVPGDPEDVEQCLERTIAAAGADAAARDWWRDHILFPLTGAVVRHQLSDRDARGIFDRVCEKCPGSTLKNNQEWRNALAGAEEKIKNGVPVLGVGSIVRAAGPISQSHNPPPKSPHGSIYPEFESFIEIRSHGGKNLILDKRDGLLQSKTEFLKGTHSPIADPGGGGTVVEFAKAFKRPGSHVVVDRCVFDPGSPSGIGKSNAGLDTWNRWQGFDLEGEDTDPVPTNRCPMILRYLNEVIGQTCRSDADYALHWLAWSVQNPEQKPDVALVLTGGKGSGKSTLVKIARKLHAPYSTVHSQASDVFGRFNGHLSGKLFVGLEEALWAPNNQHADQAKDLITGNTIAIEAKGRDVVQEASYHRLILTTNHAHAAPASGDERRYAILSVEKVASWGSPEWNTLYSEIDGTGIAAFYAYLKTLQLPNSDWHPRNHVPQNGALAKQKLLGLGASLEGWLLHLLDSGTIPSTKGNWSKGAVTLEASGKENLHFAAKSWQEAQPGSRYSKPFAKNAVIGALKKLGAAQNRTSSGSRDWVVPDLPTAKAQLASELGVTANDIDDFTSGA